jgi:hypothetical protein
MLKIKDLKVGSEVYFSVIFFRPRNLKPSTIVTPTRCKILEVQKNSGGFGGANIRLEFIQREFPTTTYLYREDDEYLFWTEEEAKEWFNGRIRKQTEKLQNYYETTKEKLNKLLLL